MSEPVLLPVIPLKDIVVFPSSVTPLFIMRNKSLLALEASLAVDKRVLLLAQKSAGMDHPGPSDLYEVGTVADVIQVLRLPDGSAKVLVEGQWVGRVEMFDPEAEYLVAKTVEVAYVEKPSRELQALKRGVVGLFERYASLSDKVPEDLARSIKSLEDTQQLANAIANYSHFRTEDKQRILEAVDLGEKLQIISELLAADNDLLRLENKILTQVKSQIGKNQREYFLNEQLKVIERELGLTSEEDLELEELNERIDKSRMPKAAKEKAFRELGRLAKMAPLSPEATVSRTYIEWLVDLPWGKFTKDRIDLRRAKKVLDEDHYGLEKVKDRILEFLAVMQKVEKMRGPILCLVGPPGVGKTSLARSIARSLNRKFVRFSLGGIRDEAEIRGHRRTYIGSLPGKIIQWMKKAGSMNPVFLLDEIDKMSSDFRGDPASALLETLDPEQNKAFNDHYLEVDFDLSSVMFITTANTTAGIPYPLLDRMELIRLPGYTEQEKRHIAMEHILPKQMKDHGLTKRQVQFPIEAIDTIIQSYTREAGVRNMEREIAALCRKAARTMIENSILKSITITPEVVREYLGPVRYHDLELHDASEVGVATGLAWTEVGGELLPIETTLMPGKASLTLTGKLGDVMQESAKAALSYIRSRHQTFALKPDFYKNLDIHVHVPEGAIPKDGPSAGVAIALSIISALTQRPVRSDLAMTGEITLRGRVLKIGGLKEKVLAAHRSHIRTVILPADNEAELEEIPAEVKDVLDFRPVKTVDEALAIALESGAKGKKPGPKGRPKKSGRAKPRPSSRSRAQQSLVS
jgi:ATP-dependent Lon protease